MSAFIERPAVHHSLRRVDCDLTSEDNNLSGQAEDSEDDELLTVHFGNAATGCPREEIVIDSEEESSEVSQFLCSLCAVVCKDLNSLKQHERNHSRKIGATPTEAELDEDVMFVCSLCTVVCADLQSLKQHEKIHSGEIGAARIEPQIDEDCMFVCKVCTVVCGDLELLKEHARTHLEVVPATDSPDQDMVCPEEENSDNSMFVCSVCAVVCTNLNSLKEHEKIHLKEICTMQTESECDQDVMFMCGVCTVVCGNLQSLKQHEHTHIGVPTTFAQDQNMFVCSVCTLLCEDLQSLNRHSMTHLRDRPTYPGDLNNQFSEAEISENAIMRGNSYSFKRPEILHSGAENMGYYKPENSDSSEAKISQDGKYECSVCYMIFKNLPSLLHHEISHTDDRPFKCSFCNYAGKLRENLIAHLNTHTRGKQFKCQYCDYSSLKSHSLKLHMQFHTDQYPHKCNLCLYSTACTSSLTSHYRNHHHTVDTDVKKMAFLKSRGGKHYQELDSGSVKWHRCEYCDYGTKKAYSLKLHLQAHTDKFPNKCHMCLYSTANPGNLTAHYKNHHRSEIEGHNTSAVELEPAYISEAYFEDVSPTVESRVKSYKCKYCEYSAAKPHKIRAHMVHHTDEFPNKCHLCVYSTARSGHLLYHYKYHHPSNADAADVSAEAEPSDLVAADECEQEPDWMNNKTGVEMTNKCNRCEYTAVRPHRITEHSRYHNYNYQYKCHLCVYSTANLANLNSHCRKHHRSITETNSSLKYKLRILTIPLERIAEFPSYFVCDVCQKTFTERSVLIEHKNTHLQVCQYKCEICECSFCESELLETHKKSHQKEEISSSSETDNNRVLCKIKLPPVKVYPIRSAMNRVKNMSSNFQLKKRKSFRTSSLQITADKLQQRCRLVLCKLDKGNTMKNKIECQPAIVNVDKTESSESVAGSKKDQQALEATPEVVHQYRQGLSLKNCVVQLEHTQPETLSKIQLHRCLLCEFASTSADSLKVHKDSHVKVEMRLRSRREVKHETERRLKSHTECSNNGDVSLSLHNESSLKDTANLKSDSAHHTLHPSFSENGEDDDVASSSKNTDFYKCVLCSCKSLDLESMTKHMLTCNTKKGLW